VQVVGPFLARREGSLRDRIGCAGASAIKQDQPTERRESRQELDLSWHEPQQFDVTAKALEVHEIDRPAATDAVCDLGTIHGDVTSL
jgi:hypothetical protein